MQTKTLEAHLIEANNLVKRLSYDESVDLINNTQTVIIDVREESEVYNLGLIKNAVHIPRGLLEFKLSPNSPNNPILINSFDSSNDKRLTRSFASIKSVSRVLVCMYLSTNIISFI